MASTFDSVNPDYRAEEMLRSWGAWQRAPSGRRGNLGYVSILQIILESNIGRIIKFVFEPTLPITEKEALLVEDAVLALMKRDTLAAKVLIYIFVYGADKTPLARELGLKRHEIEEKINKGIGFVDGQLYGKLGVMVA